MISAMVTCLALNIYHEARGEPVDGQAAVAQVTLNRVAHPDFPDDVCSVVYQPSQFSWTRHNPPVRDRKAYHKAKSIAIDALGGTLDGPLGFYVLWYHSVEVKPLWTTEKLLEGKIGNHMFYRGW